MAVTAKGKRWEILHSLWIGWTFTLGFFNWIAFLYIGIRANQRKWLLWGAFYSIPFVFAMFTPGRITWLWNVIVALTIMFGVAGIIHAFRIRGEYLLRLEALQGDKSKRETITERQVSPEQGASTTQQPENYSGLAGRPSGNTSATKNGFALTYEDLFKVCAKYEGDGYYVGDAIGQKRWANAQTHLRIPDTERIVALIDTSVLKSGKIGVAVAEGGIYWRNDWTAPTKTYRTSLPWAEFASVPIVFKDKPANIVELGKGSVFFVTENDIKKEDLAELLSEVQSLARTRAEEAQGPATTGQSTQTPAGVGSSGPHGDQERTTKSPPIDSTPRTSTSKPTLASAERSRQVLGSGADIGAVSPPILSADELEYQISSSHPFPLAFGFRSLASVVDVRDLYREQLRIAENKLAFLASVSLALLREEHHREANVELGEYWRSGISPGDWKEIVARCSKVFAAYDDPLAQAISKLNIRSEKKGFGADVIALIRAKNDYKHDRGPVVLEDIATASREVQDRLRRCMGALAFFAEYPMRQVLDFDVDRSGDEFSLKCLRYMGDHPSFPQEELVFHKGLRKGDLYLDLGNQDWVPLYPFILPMTCSHCKARETYFIDIWDQRRDTALMKSFERGHTMSNSGVSQALASW